MTVKVSGAEWKRFYTDKAAWPDGAWHDDEEITVDGQAWDPGKDLATVDDAVQMVIAGGIVFMRENDEDGPSLETHFRKWRKAQNTVFGSVEAPRHLVESVKAAIAAAGGKAHGF